MTLACINQLAITYLQQAFLVSLVCILYICIGASYIAASVANGNPSFCNAHSACMHVLKVSKKLQLTALSYKASHIYVTTYV